MMYRDASFSVASTGTTSSEPTSPPTWKPTRSPTRIAAGDICTARPVMSGAIRLAWSWTTTTYMAATINGEDQVRDIQPIRPQRQRSEDARAGSDDGTEGGDHVQHRHQQPEHERAGQAEQPQDEPHQQAGGQAVGQLPVQVATPDLPEALGEAVRFVLVAVGHHTAKGPVELGAVDVQVERNQERDDRRGERCEHEPADGPNRSDHAAGEDLHLVSTQHDPRPSRVVAAGVRCRSGSSDSSRSISGLTASLRSTVNPPIERVSTPLSQSMVSSAQVLGRPRRIDLGDGADHAVDHQATDQQDHQQDDDVAAHQRQRPGEVEPALHAP